MKTILFSLLILIATASFGQDGPAGVGSSSNNPLWLDAADFIGNSNGISISTWSDKSGNGNDFTQGSTSLQPKWYNYTTPILRFDGANDFMKNSGIAGLNTNTQTQFIVFESTSANHYGILWASAYSEHNSLLQTFRTSGGLMRSWVKNSAASSIKIDDAHSTNTQIWTSTWDGVGAQEIQAFRDGNDLGTTTNAGNTATGNFKNRVGSATNGSNKFNGDIAEIISYSKVLNSAERRIVENYLSTKHGIVIATDLYAYDATEGEELFGIGEEVDGNNTTAQGTGIIEISNASTLGAGDYILSGHNGSSIALTNNDVSGTISGGSRVRRKWRAGVTGSPGTVTVAVDVSSLPLASGSYYLMVETGNGVFNDGGVVDYGPVVDVGGIATFTGVTLSDGDYYTIASSVPSSIFSVKNGFWDDASTWSCNCIPGSVDNVTISAGDKVTTRAIESINDIVVDGNLDTDDNPGFNVAGDYTVSASGVATHKVITFNGGALTSQFVNNNSATVIDFNKLYIESVNDVNLASGDFEVSNSVKVTTGTLINTGAVFTFKSTASRTAVILESGGFGFFGNFIFERNFTTRNANWGDLSMPVTSATLGQWDSDNTNTVTELFMSDVNGIDGRVGNPGDFYSVYEFDAGTQAYAEVTDTNFVMTPGEGLEIWLGDDFTTFNAKTIDIYGTPNFGNVAVSVANDFNLVGNPYQAWVQWGSLTKPTLNNTYYIWNTNNGNYSARTSGTIPPQQGFWVESVGAGTLIFTESAKNSTGSSTFYRTTELIDFTEVKLIVNSDVNSYSHELLLRMNNLALEERDEFDGSFLKSPLTEAPSITSFANNSNKELAINSFNYSEEVIIPVKVNVGITGKYTILAENFQELSGDFEFIELKAKHTGRVFDLKNIALEGMKFEIDANDESERFQLRLSNIGNGAGAILSDNIEIYKNSIGTTVFNFNTPDNYIISVFNALGQKVVEDMPYNGEGMLEIANSKFPKGIMMIRVESQSGIVTKKFNY